MYDISISLKDDFALLIPVDDAANPEPLNFHRMDTEKISGVHFYDAEEKLITMIPWVNVNKINFKALD